MWVVCIEGADEERKANWRADGDGQCIAEATTLRDWCCAKAEDMAQLRCNIHSADEGGLREGSLCGRTFESADSGTGM